LTHQTFHSPKRTEYISSLKNIRVLSPIVLVVVIFW
jgi:hypothetical protein